MMRWTTGLCWSFPGLTGLACLTCLTCLACLTARAGGMAAAADVAAPETVPTLAIEGSVAFQYDDVIKASDAALKTRDGYVTIEPEITVNLSPHIHLFGHLVLEPVTEPADAEHRFLKDHGLYAEELYAEGVFGPVALALGKFDPTFGWASDVAPGVYGTDFAEAYDHLEDLGLRGTITLADGPGDDLGITTVRRQLHLAAFTDDTTMFSRSAFTARGGRRRGDGGVGNTRSPQSFTVAYSDETLDEDGAVAGPSFQLAYRRLARGEGDAHDEQAVLASVQDKRDLTAELSLTTVAEAVYFSHEAGGADNATAVTLGAELNQGPWFLSTAYSLHDVRHDSSPLDYRLTASIGRTVELGPVGDIRVDLGYAYGREDGETSHTIGVHLVRAFDWQR